MEPLKALINNSDKVGKSWTNTTAGCLEAAIVNGAPTQVKLEEIDEAVANGASKLTGPACTGPGTATGRSIFGMRTVTAQKC